MTTRAALVSLFAALVSAGPAHGAGVSTKAENGVGKIDTLYVTGGPGEDNDLRVEFSEARSGWVVSDSGAPLMAGTGCSIDGGGLFCPAAPGTVHRLGIELRDGNDTIVVAGPHTSGNLSDGPGDDDVTLESGVGAIRIAAGLGADSYDSASADAVMSYVARERGVTIIPDGAANDGEAGEGDNVQGRYSSFVGSAYADDLRADDNGMSIGSTGGDDMLTGGAGADRIGLSGVGNPSVQGGGGDDTIAVPRSGLAGVLSGGPGMDSLVLSDPGGPAPTLSGPGVDVTLDGSANDGGQRNILPDFEKVDIRVGRLTGSDAPETLTASAYVDGRGGDDVITSGGTTIGGPGRDVLRYVGRNDPFAAVDALDGEPDTIGCNGKPGTFTADSFDVGPCPQLPVLPPPPADPVFGTISAHNTSTRADRRGYVVLRIKCAAASPAACSGTASIRARTGSRTTYASQGFRKIQAGKSKRVRFKLAARFRRTLVRGRSLAGRLVIDTTAPDTATVQRNESAGFVRVMPPRRRKG